VVKVKILIKGKLKLAWGTSVFLVGGVVFSQVINGLPINVIVSRVFKDSI
jgi:hypothetical protein